MRGPTFAKKCRLQNIVLFFFDYFCRRFCQADVDSREQQAILLKKGKKISPKIAFFLFFRRKLWHDFVTPFSTFANIKGFLPTESTTPGRLRCQARPSDEGFPVFGQLFFRTSPAKKVFFRARHLVVIYIPEAHSQIFVTGGSEFA